LAIELAADGITVNAVAPGPVATPLAEKEHTASTRDAYSRLIPIGRYATPDEAASAVQFLCSEEAGYVTGHTIPFDGGYLAAGVLSLRERRGGPHRGDEAHAPVADGPPFLSVESPGGHGGTAARRRRLGR
jgi:hypothetical protein